MALIHNVCGSQSPRRALTNDPSGKRGKVPVMGRGWINEAVAAPGGVQGECFEHSSTYRRNILFKSRKLFLRYVKPFVDSLPFLPGFSNREKSSPLKGGFLGTGKSPFRVPSCLVAKLHFQGPVEHRKMTRQGSRCLARQISPTARIITARQLVFAERCLVAERIIEPSW